MGGCMNQNIAENIKLLRNARKLTQTELANRVGISNGAISAYELGSRMPSYEILIKLAQVFKVSTDNLLGFSNQYMIDVSKLNVNQRTAVQEIVYQFERTNNTLLGYLKNDSVHDEIMAAGVANFFDIEEYKKQNGIK
jgi:transcriptional regulator with XRE-family HTH domain